MADTTYITMVPPPVPEEEDVYTPSPGVDEPWTNLEDPEAGYNPQVAAGTQAPAYTTDPYGNYGQGPAQGFRYTNRTARPEVARGMKSNWMKLMGGWGASLAGQAAGGAMTGGSAAGGSGAAAYGTSSASGPGAESAAQHNYGYGGGEGGAQGETGGSYSATASPSAFSLAMAAYSGYQAAPIGAVYARESGDPQPYYAGNAEGGFFQTLGGRNDKEANQAHGERTSMTAAGFVAGFVSGGGNVWTGLAGAGGAQFAENPYTGKRGYQEEWRYNIKPVGEGIGGEAKSLYSGQLPQKGNTLRNLTNIKGYGRAFDFRAGPGPKPPKKKEIKEDIGFGMGKRISMDYNIRTWWNEIATKGGEAGREYALSALAEGERTRVDDPELPSWLQGKHGSKNDPYDWRPEQIGDKRVASQWTGNYLAALQNEYERIGDKKEFHRQYIENYNMYSEGGAGLSDKWHGKTLYRIPSEVAGKTFEEMFPGIEPVSDFTPNYWETPQLMEEEEA